LRTNQNSEPGKPRAISVDYPPSEGAIG